MKKTEITRIPIAVENLESDGYHIFVPVRVGKRTVRALIDTGASKTVISRELAESIGKFNLMETRDSLARGLGEETLETEVGILPSLRIGELKLKTLIVGILDLAHIRATYEELGLQPFEMILGGDILVKHQAVINYKKATLKLSL